ncbi:diacylglycerol kinase family protein [Ramlibacter alkalitolerans]|nr:diacylglycerol kinase family protein [Ramlibacter alkalitolerans]
MNARLGAVPDPAAAGVEGASLPPCLIVNPLSFRASRGLAQEACELARARGAEVVSIDSPAALSAAVETILARRQRKVMVLAGDGTVRAVVEQLAALPAGAWIPDLLVLPGGRTNLIANDLIPGAAALDLLRRALAPAHRWDASIAERFTLCIEQDGAPARHGFWVGAALIDSVIRRTHEHRAGGTGALRTGHLSTVAALLGLASKALRGRSGLTAPRLRVRAGAAGVLMEGPVSLLVATTLHHRKGLFDPYVSRAADDLRLTAVSRHADRFWACLPRLLTGRFSPAMDPAHGYVSGSFARVEITGVAGYSLDGEAYDADPQRPLILRRGTRLRFVVA